MNGRPETEIALDGLRLRAGARELATDLTLAIGRGERWAILGPNGAGKSNLLAVMAGLRAPHAGEVTLAGRPLPQWTVEALAARRALVTDRWLDPFAATVLDTVLTSRFRFGGADAGGVARAQAELAQLDCADLVWHDVRTLSRGERQRVALATALSQEAPLLLADEPTSHQDPRHQALVLQRLMQLPQTTLVASMHDVNAAAHLATHVLLLSGCGRWRAGPVRTTLNTAALTELFGARFDEVATASGRLFHLGRDAGARGPAA